MEAILQNFEQGIKDGLAKAREANTGEPLVGVSLLRALAEKWEAHAARVSGDWYNDAPAYEECADDLRDIIKANAAGQGREAYPAPACSALNGGGK